MNADKDNLQFLISECRYGVSGKGPGIEVANDLLVECCDNIEALIAENESLHKHWQNESNNVQVLAAEAARLNSENTGLKTGYEAYGVQNATLMAEIEAMRKTAPSSEVIWCACGDGYGANSYGAGFMDANKGVCANCDAAMGKGEQP